MSWLVGVFGLALSLGFKLLGLARKSQADKVAATDHALLEDAINRTDPRDVAGKLRADKF